MLERAVERMFDRKTIGRTKEAIGRYHASRRAGDPLDAVFEDRDFRVERLFSRYTPEIEYGVTLKSSNTRTIHSAYVWDDGTGKISHSYQLADENFESMRRMSDR